MTIQFTSIDPHIDAGSGEAYYFTYSGTDYYVECWATDNASGEDIYEEGTGRAVGDLIFQSDEDAAEFETKLEQIKTAYMKAWAELVADAERAAIQRALTEVGAPGIDTAGSASRQHYIETGRYLTSGEEQG